VKQSILLIVLIAFVLPVVNAVPDSFVTGPYKVSFDLGLKSDEYTVNVTAPVITETLGGDKLIQYSVLINPGTYFGAAIKIEYSEGERPITTGRDWELVLKSSAGDDPRVSRIVSDTRTIDGASGAIASAIVKLDTETIVDEYHAFYQAPFDPTHILVEIASYYPWDKGTLQLLKTIHVEKV
jgi:hypothetical protein